MRPFSTLPRKYALHIAFWVVYASFFFYQISFARNKGFIDWGTVLLDFGFHIASMAFISYLNYFLFIPRFLQRRHIGRYMLEFLPLFVAYSYGVVWVKRLILDQGLQVMPWIHSPRFAVIVIFNALGLVIFVGVLRFVEDWFELEAAQKQLENERLTAELRFLKAQINPHFLFNTLNNLYYLAYTQSPNTTGVIDKLSQMMRYMLYESNNERVALTHEIAYLNNYIGLERLRLEANIPIDFQVTGPVEGVQIAPLILITFLENAFKHGVSNSRNDSWIKAAIHIEGATLTYSVHNSKIADHNKTLTEPSGIGLANAQRRLELTYPKQYRLDTHEGDHDYRITLTLSL